MADIDITISEVQPIDVTVDAATQAIDIQIGDIATIAWGDITGTLSNQTDLQAALDAKEPTITAGTATQYWRGDKTFQELNGAAVALDTTNFNKNLSAADTNAQLAFDTLDELVSMEIGEVITGATEGSVLFAGVGGIMQQDNTNFFWDDTNNRLGIGTNTPDEAFHLKSATGNVTMKFDAASGWNSYLELAKAGVAQWKIQKDNSENLIFRNAANSAKLQLNQNGSLWHGTTSGTAFNEHKSLGNTSATYNTILQNADGINTAIFRDDGRLGFGLGISDSDLTSNPLTIRGSAYRVVNDGRVQPQYESYRNSSLHSRFRMLASRGTEASPLALLAGDDIGEFDFRGGDGGTPAQVAALKATASENFTVTGHGTGLIFYTTKNGTTARAQTLSLENDGALWHGTTSGTAFNEHKSLGNTSGTDNSIFQNSDGTNLLQLRDDNIVLGTGSIKFEGATGAYPTFTTNAHTMAWISSKAAFRAGQAYTTHWDDANVGLYSSGFGYRAKAKGLGAFAAGYTSEALGSSDISLGNNLFNRDGSGVDTTGGFCIKLGSNSVTRESVAVSIGTDINQASFGVSSTGDYQSTSIGRSIKPSRQGTVVGSNLDFTSCNNDSVLGDNISSATFRSGRIMFGRYLYSGNSNDIIFGKGVDATNRLTTTAAGIAFASNSTVPSLFIERASGVGTYGNVGIGTDSPLDELEVNGDFRISRDGDQTNYLRFLVGVNSGSVSFKDAAVWNIRYDNDSYLNAGKLGIKINPITNSEGFQIATNMRLTSGSNTSATTAILVENSDLNNLFSVRDDSLSTFGAYGSNSIVNINDVTNSESTVHILSRRQNVVAPIASSALATLCVQHNDNHGIQILSNATNRDQYLFFGDSSDGDVGWVRYDHATDVMSFQTNATEKMWIDPAGNVGIGITNPTSELHLPQENDASTPTLSFGDGTDGIFNNNTGSMRFALGGIARLQISTTGLYEPQVAGSRWNFELSSATNPIFCPGTNDSDTGLGAAGLDQLDLITGGVNALHIDSSQNISIGSTTTDGKLATYGASDTSADYSFKAKDNSGTDLFSVRDDGLVGIGLDTAGGTGRLSVQGGSITLYEPDANVLAAQMNSNSAGGWVATRSAGTSIAIMSYNEAKFNYNVKVGSYTSPDFSLDVSGGNARSVVTKTANYTATINDSTILVDATTGNITITLPTAASAYNSTDNTGLILKIKRVASDSSANSVTIDGNGAETIDNALTQSVVAAEVWVLQSDGTEWHAI